MATSTSAIAVSDQEQELHRLLQERLALNKRMESDRAAQANAQSERTRLIAAIAGGQNKEAEVRRVDETLGTLAIRFESYAGALSANKTQIDALERSVATRNTENLRIQRANRLAELETAAYQKMQRMLASVTRLLTVEILEFDEIRDAIMREFPDGVSHSISVERFQENDFPSEVQGAGTQLLFKLTKNFYATEGIGIGELASLQDLFRSGWTIKQSRRNSAVTEIRLRSLQPPPKNAGA